VFATPVLETSWPTGPEFSNGCAPAGAGLGITTSGAGVLVSVLATGGAGSSTLAGAIGAAGVVTTGVEGAGVTAGAG
jgi:hypothetical protein